MAASNDSGGLRLAFYPGCLVLQRMPEYEMAARAVLSVLGIELDIVQQALCCGAPVIESFTGDWVYLSAYNLAQAKAMGHSVLVTLCGSCTNALTRTTHLLERPDVRAEATRRLAPLGLEPANDVTVRHLMRLLSEREEELRARIVHPLSLRVALTAPCQVFRPGDQMAFDDPMAPQAMRRLIGLTGAEVMDYAGENECCGATLYLANPPFSYAAGRRKLEAVREADVLVHACGNCQLLLGHFQRLVIGDDRGLRKRALFLPQLLGLALGLPEAALGLREDSW